jgi:hypothetical protein
LIRQYYPYYITGVAPASSVSEVVIEASASLSVVSPAQATGEVLIEASATLQIVGSMQAIGQILIEAVATLRTGVLSAEGIVQIEALARLRGPGRQSVIMEAFDTIPDIIVADLINPLEILPEAFTPLVVNGYDSP